MLSHESQQYGVTAHLIDRVRKNRILISEDEIIKQRRWWGKGLIYACNLFLRFSNTHIFIFSQDEVWQRWELHSYQLLYGIEGELMGSHAIRIPAFKGRSLRAHIAANTLTPMMITATAYECQRVHRLYSPVSGRHWTHGDLHTGNVLYHDRTGCAYLIDFDTQHETRYSEVDCRADDLLVFTLDLLGTRPDWVYLTELFLTTYADPAVLRQVAQRLHTSSGLEYLLWKIRANYLPLAVLRLRVNQLRHILNRILREVGDVS